MSTILKVENVSKQYRLGLVGTGTLSHDLNRWWHRLRGKEDPYLKVGAKNDRSAVASSDYVWALQDINFEVQQGEVLGIIGKNGAGKSTLLKILSKVTGPTTGIIKSNGRIASLLEVGTGFHPELTGRENIFLNGAILGMTKAEINSKIDEIVSFSGCEMYVDTPVKRYSSGMRVRLAFAVAAHLEPDILVIDEVLAVGDAEFQKKAIGKMQDISKSDGRTVLFVSHNMAAVKSLCTRAIVLEHGKVAYEGDVNGAINYYLLLGSDESNISTHKFLKEDRTTRCNELNLISLGVKSSEKDFGEPMQLDIPIRFEIKFDKLNKKDKIDITLKLKDNQGNYILTTSTRFADMSETNIGKDGEMIYTVEFPDYFFSANQFFVDLIFLKNDKVVLLEVKDIICYTIVDASKKLGTWMGKLNTPLRVKMNWQNY